ncbi:response regulator transcription factor [Dactylosporangium darangshiense]|uniref:Response regulator transcription factor n=1 Tax=Dactylosporangium darangshiense TaxID=579108 RepID=A0ABP8DW39_9ACTN
MRVMVAEDSGIVGKALAAGLAEHGIEVIGIARSIAALQDLMTSETPDLITLDLQMPWTDEDRTPEFGAGLVAATQLRTARPRLPIVVVSQFDQVPMMEEVLKLGPHTAYLLKDRIEDIPELIAIMHAVAAGDTRMDQTLYAKLLNRKREHDRVQRLTSRELEVFALLVQGYSNKAISKRLFLVESTIEGHERSIYRKLDLDAALSAEHGIVDDADRRNRRVMAVLAYLRWGRSQGGPHPDI